MVGSAAIKQGRSANRKHTYFFFWPNHTMIIYIQYTFHEIPSIGNLEMAKDGKINEI